MLDGADLSEKIHGMIATTIEQEVAACTSAEDRAEWSFGELRNYFMGTLTTRDDFRYTDEELAELDPEAISNELKERAERLCAEKERIFGEETYREIQRVILLKNVDAKWMEHLDAMDDLRGSIGLHAYAQRNPVTEYRIQGADMFDEMIVAIRQDTVRAMLSVIPRPKEEIKRVSVARVTSEGFAGGKVEKERPKVLKRAEKVGRNDPCPCGSGKKYKKCCGAGGGEEA